MPKISPLTSISSRLKIAIANLEKFVTVNPKNTLDLLAKLKVREGKLISEEKSTFELIKNCIESAFSKHAREQRRLQKTEVERIVYQAIDTVKRNLPLIKELSQGNSEEQEIAETTISTITRFNAAIADSKAKESEWSWTAQLARFLYLDKDSSLGMMHNECMDLSDTENFLRRRRYQKENFKSIPLLKNNRSFSHSQDVVLTQEADALRLKAATLLKAHHIHPKVTMSNSKTIRISPISHTLNPATSISTLTLNLRLLPEMTVSIVGSFKRNKKKQSIPLSETFQLTCDSIKTGFPHPSQYTAWALSEELLPSYPHYPNQMPQVKQWIDLKKSIERELHPHGRFFERAQTLWHGKTASLLSRKDHFLNLHRELALALLKELNVGDRERIDLFFDHLATELNPFEKLADVYALIHYFAMTHPYKFLERLWLEGTHPQLVQSLPQTLDVAIKLILEEHTEVMDQFLTQNATLDQMTAEYLNLFIRGLIPFAVPLLTLYLSEMFGCSPPPLSLTSQKLMILTFRQLTFFWEELNDPKIDPSDLMLEEKIAADMRILSASSLESLNDDQKNLVQEITNYYQFRHKINFS